MIEEHNRELLSLNMKFGDSLLEAVHLLQESDAFLEKVKVENSLANNLIIIHMQKFLDSHWWRVVQFSCNISANYKIKKF